MAFAQSGRKTRPAPVPTPPPQSTTETKPKTDSTDEPAKPITAERNEDYRCGDDGDLERYLEPLKETVISSRTVDERAVILRKPAPSYTKEARRTGVQGFVVLRLLLAADRKVSRIRVIKGLRAGLTENAMRVACKITFKPAIKDGQPVSQWVEAEYVFRLY